MLIISSKLLFNLGIIIVIVPTMFYTFWVIFEPWFRLSKIYETNKNPPKVLLKNQRCLLGNTRINGHLNIGVTKQDIYLSYSYSYGNSIKPLSINWNEIAQVEPCIEPYFGEVLGKCYKFFIGNPTITTLTLTQELIEKLEEDYGEPIFSNKLGELN